MSAKIRIADRTRTAKNGIAWRLWIAAAVAATAAALGAGHHVASAVSPEVHGAPVAAVSSIHGPVVDHGEGPNL